MDGSYVQDIGHDVRHADEGHSAADWGMGWSVIAVDCGRGPPKSVRSGNGLPLLALRHLVSLPLRIVDRCWSGFPCKWR